jgi:hypothetical protein
LAIVAAVLVGMAWWLSLDRLSAEERLLVNTWIFEVNPALGGLRWHFWPDDPSAPARTTSGGNGKNGDRKRGKYAMDRVFDCPQCRTSF